MLFGPQTLSGRCSSTACSASGIRVSLRTSPRLSDSLLTPRFLLDLLYIHRSKFAQATREMPQDPLQHSFAPSVLAIFRSATQMINSLKSLYALHSDAASQVWFFWSGIFSACVSISRTVLKVRETDDNGASDRLCWVRCVSRVLGARCPRQPWRSSIVHSCFTR
jgi:hypothetical protein